MIKEGYIKAISYYLPEAKLSNEDLTSFFPEWSVEKVANKIGINSRHVASQNETISDMAYHAAVNLFSEWDIKPSEIDFIILCTQSPDYFLPTTACVLQDRLNISTNAGAFDFNLGCSGYIYGLAIAKGLISAGIASNILLITSEAYSKHIHPKDKGNRAIFGDAASASVISDNGFAKIEKFILGTDGSGSNNLIVKNAGLKHPNKENNVIFDKNGVFIESSDHLYMNGAEIFSFTQNNVPLLVSNILNENNLEMENVDLYILHQANKYMLEFLRKKMKITEDKFFYYMSEIGNTVSSTIPIAIYEAYKAEKLKGNVLIAGFGVGYSWGGTILKVE